MNLELDGGGDSCGPHLKKVRIKKTNAVRNKMTFKAQDDHIGKGTGVSHLPRLLPGSSGNCHSAIRSRFHLLIRFCGSGVLHGFDSSGGGGGSSSSSRNRNRDGGSSGKLGDIFGTLQTQSV